MLKGPAAAPAELDCVPHGFGDTVGCLFIHEEEIILRLVLFLKDQVVDRRVDFRHPGSVAGRFAEVMLLCF